MAKLTRLTGKVFAGNAQLTDLGVFGSAAAGTPTNPTRTNTESQIQANSAYGEGWTSAVVTNKNFPPIEEVNGVLRTISYQNCYLLQEGVPEYDINTEYTSTSIVKSITNNILTFYHSQQNNNVGHALSDTSYWKAVKYPVATSTRTGVVMPDNVTTIIDGSGVISALIPNEGANKDFSNVTQTAINTSISWGMPDWSRIVSKTPYIEYTATKRGWINAEGKSADKKVGLTINSNTVAAAEARSTADESCFACLVPVDVGDVYNTFKTGTNVQDEVTSIKFIPCKGEA